MYQNQPIILPTELHIDPAITAKQPIIIGVDEVGRGCLFGQMTVCACILPSPFAINLTDHLGNVALSGTIFEQLTDSKKLSEKRRIALNELIKAHASYAIIDVSAQLIDEINIHNATLLGMKSAITALTAYYVPTKILVDGIHAPKGIATITTLPKGDSIHASIAGASVIAKVHRDTAMDRLAKLYPHYGLNKHKGYPTPAHKQALLEFGISAEHRKSYQPIAKLLAKP